jgi:Arc/MetJ family transcription regulator
MLYVGLFDGDGPMRTTIALDDELIARAGELTGLTEKSAIRAALTALIEREARAGSRGLAAVNPI